MSDNNNRWHSWHIHLLICQSGNKTLTCAIYPFRLSSTIRFHCHDRRVCRSSQKGWLTEACPRAILELFKNERMEGSPLESISNARIFDILAKSRKHYGKQFESICKEWKLTRNEMDVLLFLHNNPWFDRAADIVSLRGIAKSHVSLSVKNLEHRGLLERRFEPADRRTVHLVLTEQGQAIAGEGCQAQRRFFTALYDGITEEEFAQWKHTVQKICGNIDKMEISE